ncbi:glycosyltransferase [Scatolibacter rhodanostii]|uniref:glycosyltransferase n=1 Tax=Scatolibacter rhodanostii TaxID=2014781 RepID=UPI000C07929A|nr:glycosyltransferase [Scatolibacter rhodanostii]
MNEKKKILFMTNHLDLGGVERVILDIVNGMDSEKFDITLICLFRYEPQKFEIAEHVKVKKIFGFYFKGFSALLSHFPQKWLYKWIVREKYDYEVAFQAGEPTLLLAHSKNKEAPKYCWVHGLDMTNPEANDCYDKIIFVGQAVKEHYQHLFANQDKLLVRYNPMDFTQITKFSEEAVEEKPSDVPVLCAVGRLSEEKGFLRLLSAVKKLCESHYPVRLWLVGDGYQREELEKFVEMNQLQSVVKFWGFQKNPYKFLKRADCFVCSSFIEGFSVAASEALFLEKPIVTTDVFGMAELIADSEAGIITENSEDAFYNGLVQILTGNNLDKYTQNAKKRASAFFGQQDRIRGIEELFQ